MLEIAADTVVIGSGSGGAPVACRLAEAGLDVLLIEEGGNYNKEDFTQREAQMMDRLFRERAAQAPADFSVRVLQGRCVGGSTVVNMGDVVPLTAEVHQYWHKHHDFPLSFSDLTDPLARALTRIDARQIPDWEVNRNGQLMQRGAVKKNWRNGVLHDNRKNCIGSGYCMLGCSYDAKRSMITNYVPQGQAAGMRLLPGTLAQRLLVAGDTVRAVEAVTNRPVSLDGQHFAAGAHLSVKAKRVIVACGAIHSPLLLARSGISLPALGRNLSLQPQAMVAARFADPVIGFRGIPQSAFMDEFLLLNEDQGLGGFILESVMAGPAQAATFSPGFGQALRQQMQGYRHLAACLVLCPDKPIGFVESWVGNHAHIAYRFSRHLRKTLWRGMTTAAELYLAAGAKEVYLMQEGQRPIRSLKQLRKVRDRGRFVPVATPTISAHPQGTCRMGIHPHNSVVNGQFGVHGTRNLFVCDTSIYPTTSSTHTMTPTLTFSELLADQLLASI